MKASTILIHGEDVLGIDLRAGTVFTWPDGEQNEVVARFQPVPEDNPEVSEVSGLTVFSPWQAADTDLDGRAHRVQLYHEPRYGYGLTTPLRP